MGVANVRLAGDEVEVVQVSEQAEAAAAGALEQVRVEPVGLVGRVLAVAIDEWAETVDGADTLTCDALAVQGDVGFVAVGATDFPECSGQVVLRLVEQAEVVGEVHRQASGVAVASAGGPPVGGGAGGEVVWGG